eukprot:Pgem_evm1s5397
MDFANKAYESYKDLTEVEFGYLHIEEQKKTRKVFKPGFDFEFWRAQEQKRSNFDEIFKDSTRKKKFIYDHKLKIKNKKDENNSSSFLLSFDHTERNHFYEEHYSIGHGKNVIEDPAIGSIGP